MDLPVTELGNRHVVVFQDFLTKWPLVFPVPDQKAVRLVKLLTEEVIPLFGVPEALLSDRWTNLMSHFMLDICKKLGIRKLNTTAYHPECDGMKERFNWTSKTAICKHAATYGPLMDHSGTITCLEFCLLIGTYPMTQRVKNPPTSCLELIARLLLTLNF